MPPELGNLRNIRSLTLDGNAFRVSTSQGKKSIKLGEIELPMNLVLFATEATLLVSRRAPELKVA